jgi:hypothetical protein
MPRAMDVTELDPSKIWVAPPPLLHVAQIGCASFEDVHALGRIMSGVLSSIEHDDSD